MKNKSLRFRLISILSLLALATWGLSSLLAWWQTTKEVSQVFDAQQVLFAQRLASSNLRNILVEHKHHQFDSHKHKHFKKAKFEDDALAFAIFTDRGEMLLSDSENGQNFFFQPQAGFQQSTIAEDDDQWRIFWLPIANGKLWIAVGQEIEYRQEVIQKIVFSQLGVWIASLPFLIALIWWIISKELASLQRLRQELLQRSPTDSNLLYNQDLPSEIQPLVESLNGFLARTAQTLLRERRFTSDAAHELRSPLAALRIQTEVAQMAGDDVLMREQALKNLTLGIDRASQLIEQLLTLSRLDSLQQLQELQPIHWQSIISSLIAERYFSAQQRQIELAFEVISVPDSQHKTQQGEPVLLSLMLRNLLDNAIKYCPDGSKIQVELHKDHLLVKDNGNGVAETDLAKLGQRFFRPAGQNEKGSGLGLSIVQRIAELHCYQLHLQNLLDENGKISGFSASVKW